MSTQQPADINDELSLRLGQIESHLAHLEHAVEQMNEVLLAHDKLLERLKKEVQRQASAFETLELERMKSNNSRPPHY